LTSEDAAEKGAIHVLVVDDHDLFRVGLCSLRAAERDIDVVPQGKRNAAIADESGISPSTAKNHVSNILTKLGVPSRIQAAIYAVRRGLTAGF
jgi:DNA-binding NarL/FixJ family response regulator